MDKDLELLIAASNPVGRGPKPVDLKIRVKDPASGEIEVQLPGGARPYPLKPLADLYGTGTGAGTVDPKDDRFMPLMLSIEEEIARQDAGHAGLTDGAVLLVLGQLAMSPESPQSDPLAQGIQVSLRLTLSLNNYSRQEVRQGLRHVVRSVERHTRLAGRRGYLDFIRAFFKKPR